MHIVVDSPARSQPLVLILYHIMDTDSSCSLPRLACSLFMCAMNLLLSLVPGLKDGACPDTCVELLHCNVRIWNNTIIQCFLKPKIAVLCITLGLLGLKKWYNHCYKTAYILTISSNLAIFRYILHSSNLTLFLSFTLPIFHSSNLTLCKSTTLPILHSSNLTLFHYYTLPILHSSNLTFWNSVTNQPTNPLTNNVDTRDPIWSKNS